MADGMSSQGIDRDEDGWHLQFMLLKSEVVGVEDRIA
jgi:hypothetical protein